ncbi:hypothetical protein YC2023_116901 [Brassica napus]
MGSSCPLLKALSSLHLDGSLTWSLLTALFITQTGSSSLSTLFSALLYKIDLTEGDQSNKVNVIEVTGGTLRFGDGIELLSPTKIVIAGNPSTRLVESSDKWRTASVTGLFRSGMFHRLVSAATKYVQIALQHIIVTKTLRRIISDRSFLRKGIVVRVYENLPRMLQFSWFKRKRWCYCAHGFDLSWKECFTSEMVLAKAGSWPRED